VGLVEPKRVAPDGAYPHADQDAHPYIFAAHGGTDAHPADPYPADARPTHGGANPAHR